jgi:putative DNA primase/helicase
MSTSDFFKPGVVSIDSKRKTKQKAAGSVRDLEDRVALAFARIHADNSRYIAKWNRWMRWAGGRWQYEDTLAAFDGARALCRDAEDAKAKTVAAVVTLARSDRAIAAREDQWDTEIGLFNTPTKKTAA